MLLSQLGAALLLAVRGGPAVSVPSAQAAAMADSFSVSAQISAGSFGSVFVGSLAGGLSLVGPRFREVRGCRVAVKRIHPSLLATVAIPLDQQQEGAGGRGLMSGRGC